MIHGGPVDRPHRLIPTYGGYAREQIDQALKSGPRWYGYAYFFDRLRPVILTCRGRIEIAGSGVSGRWSREFLFKAPKGVLSIRLGRVLVNVYLTAEEARVERMALDWITARRRASAKLPADPTTGCCLICFQRVELLDRVERTVVGHPADNGSICPGGGGGCVGAA